MVLDTRNNLDGFDGGLFEYLPDGGNPDQIALSTEELISNGLTRVIQNASNLSVETDRPDITATDEKLDPARLIPIDRDKPIIDKRQSDEVRRQRRRRHRR